MNTPKRRILSLVFTVLCFKKSLLIRTLMLLVDLNYNFEFDWFVELSDNKLSYNKLSDNNLASELVGNRCFLKQSQSRKL